MTQPHSNESQVAGRTRTTSGGIRRMALRLSQLDKTSFLALVDQAVVSGMSLAASVVVGRQCGADGLGFYSLALTLIMLFIAFHTAIVSIPYTVFRSRIDPADEKSFAGSSLLGSSVVILFGLVALLLIYFVFRQFQLIPNFEFVVLAVAFLCPFLIMREFVRRFAFANLKMGAALLVDFSVAVFQLSALLVLAQFDLLTPVSALICLGAACALAAGIWLINNRQDFVVSKLRLKKDLRRKWAFGRWVMLEQVLGILSAQITPWLLIFLLDSTSTGVFAACLIVVNLSSPFLQGMGNSLSPKFAAAASTGKKVPINQLFWRATFFMTGTMALFVIFCMFAGEFVLQLLYREEAYSGRGLVVAILALRAMFGSANIAAHHALLAMERPLPTLYCSFIGLIVTVVGGLILIPIYGILGGGIAMLIGAVLEVLAIYWGYVLVLKNFQPKHIQPKHFQQENFRSIAEQPELKETK